MGTHLTKADADKNAGLDEWKAWCEEIRSMRLEAKDTREETMACLKTKEACPEEKQPASVDGTPEVAQQGDVPKEDAELMPVRRTKKMCRDRNRRKIKERAQKQDGCQ